MPEFVREELEMSHHAPKTETLDPTEVSRLLEAGKVLLIDVREPAEYAAERIQGALLYPLSFDATMLPADGARRVVFHCAGGRRSLTAAEKRLEAGSAHAAHMGGGIAAWKTAGLPVIAPGS
jgi:rhodanese-related sulfurtransferase